MLWYKSHFYGDKVLNKNFISFVPRCEQKAKSQYKLSKRVFDHPKKNFIAAYEHFGNLRTFFYNMVQI